MGSGYRHRCERCGFEIATSGPWEFYRDRLGLRHPYGHPEPCSREAERAGIHGFSAAIYCPDCGQAGDVILVEFKRPVTERLELWFGSHEPLEEFKQEGAVKCLSCGGTNWVLAPNPDREIKCPQCKEGKLVGRQAWIS